MDQIETKAEAIKDDLLAEAEAKEKDGKKPSYVFGNVLGNAMAKIDTRTQYEASMLSMAFMMLGLIVTFFYLVIYSGFPTWYKWFLSFNVIAGVVFMSSFLITTFQQYRGYMEVLAFQEENDSNDLKGGSNAKESI